MCHGYRGAARWWDAEVERRRLELLQRREQERERDRDRREQLRARQEQELQRLEKTLTPERSRVSSG